jgi:hypothetical protein
MDMCAKDFGQLVTGPDALLDPTWKLTVPNECMAADTHVVRLREGEDLLEVAEVIALRLRVNVGELQRVLWNEDVVLAS